MTRPSTAASSTPTWFSSGLRFECTQCSACCRISGTVYVAPDELEALAAARSLELATLCATELYAFRDGYSVDENGAGECLYLDDQGYCSVYEARPRQCRSFPFWKKLLRDPRHWKAAAENCPGMGQGKLHSEQQVLAIMERSPI